MKTKQLFILAVVLIVMGTVVIVALIRQQPAPVTDTQIASDEVYSDHYVAYSEEALAQAQEKGRAVLYFWASWCPTCRVLDAELKERGDELPDDVTILQVNFDTEKDLKRRYGITQQHTLVQIDNEGNEVTKWIGGNFDVISGVV
ncbi:thioredoxin family protein [Candidatus Roizmanbacteria bacterium]|nr:thioredoxin family protein [Candidatus Roizmanbacteria bacterium]